MCEPISTGTLVSAGLMAAGTYMQMQAQEEAAQRQQQALNATLEQQDQYNRAAEQKSMENAQEYQPEKRAQRFENARQEAGDSLVQQLTTAREQAPKTEQASGRLSQEFLTGQAKAAADQFQQSVDMARLMGKMRGPQDMLNEEGYTNADYASQLAVIGRNARGAYQAAQPGIEAAGRADSGSMLAGGMLQGVGTAGLSSRLGKELDGIFGAKKVG